MTTKRITASVGRGGLNRVADVKLVQELLNSNLPIPYRPLAVNGVCGPETISVIEAFQRRVLLITNPDARVDVGGRTYRMLAGLDTVTAPLSTKPFLTRVDEFRAHVKAEFAIDIAVNSGLRGAVWQQRMHVAHMIKFNSYKNLEPRKHTSIGGHNLIAFDHLADAKVVWGSSITPDEFLRDKNGRPCKRKTDLSGYDPEPDEARTRARALEVLTKAGIGTPEDRPNDKHSAQVAPGVQGCAEPCACGGNRSRHLAGFAVDLDRSAVARLESKLTPPTRAQLDKLFSEFQLKRPLVDEPWHVEPK